MLDGNDIVIISIVNVTCFVFAYHPFAIRWEGISHRRILIHIYPNVYTIASRVRGARNIDGVVCAKSTIVLWSWWSRQTDNQSDKAKKLTRHTHTHIHRLTGFFSSFSTYSLWIFCLYFLCALDGECFAKRMQSNVKQTNEHETRQIRIRLCAILFCCCCFQDIQQASATTT